MKPKLFTGIVLTLFLAGMLTLISNPVKANPSVNVFEVVWEAETYYVTILSNSSISGFNFSQLDKSISFNVTGPGTTGFCNVTIPKRLLRANDTHPWTVLIDEMGITGCTDIVENATHTSVYLDYSHTTHKVQIIGAYIPWWFKEWSLVHWIKDRISYINVTLVFPDTGYNVSDWGTVIKDGHEIWVDSKILQWPGPTLPVIIEEHHTYDLGYLEKGKYNFTFKVWGDPVKNITFTISKPVGGFVISVSKLELLMPYIGVISVVLVTITVVVKKRRLNYTEG